MTSVLQRQCHDVSLYVVSSQKIFALNTMGKCTVMSGAVVPPVMLCTMHPKTHSKYFFHICDYC